MGWVIAAVLLALAGLSGALVVRTRARERRAEEEARRKQEEQRLARERAAPVLAGRFRLYDQIGEGGFGAVFRAHDLQGDRPAAVKVLRPRSRNDGAGALERFRLECEFGRRVRHANVVEVLASGTSDEGWVYLAMELLDGRPLADELRERGRLEQPRAVRIACDVLAALDAAHAASVIHRDVKPDNVFLHRGPQGELAKVLDFGVARQHAEGKARGMTLSGTIVGTPQYMAPERLEDQPYDGRSDVYALGVVLYEMLIGRPPFVPQTKSVLELMDMHLNHAPVPPCEVDRAIGRPLSDAVLAALEKDPRNRPRAAELRERLSQAARARG